ncbi:MAG: outer membrane protein assembly factor BamE [Rhodocyclaceae bacterium]|nr:outer membrane protein assembly factor BamE [Rhodocyclaceae bacterium]
MKKTVLVALLPLVAACSSTPDVTSALTAYRYRVDVRQGNLVTQEMAAKLKPGQTRDQVRFILGTPLVADMFHTDRWDYLYRFQPGKGEVQQRRLVVFFEDGRLSRLGGDVIAQQAGEGAAAQPAARVIDIAGEKKE